LVHFILDGLATDRHLDDDVDVLGRVVTDGDGIDAHGSAPWRSCAAQPAHDSRCARVRSMSGMNLAILRSLMLDWQPRGAEEAGEATMILGMSLSTFTLVHVVISLIGIATGLIVLWGMLGGERMAGLTAVFLITTVLTSVTGFMFPFNGVLPSHIVGGISLVV